LQTSPGIHAGVWKSPKTGERIADQSRKFVVAVAPDRVGELRILLAQACSVFCQQCIYLSVAGAVEFVESTHNGRST
jgi:hypothetical protein